MRQVLRDWTKHVSRRWLRLKKSGMMKNFAMTDGQKYSVMGLHSARNDVE